MQTLTNDIRVLSGSTDIVLVAPHGPAEDDENTDRLTRQTARLLGCMAIINTELPRNKLDLNRIPDAARHPTFIHALRQAISPDGRSRVIWVHGMKDQSAALEARNLNDGVRIDCLVGYGLPDRLTADLDTITHLTAGLNAGGLNTVVAADERSKFRGHSDHNMNQWFRKNRYPISRVASLQLELSWSGVREEGCLSKTAKTLGSALKQFMNLNR
ncbi:MAG: hypothetical protein QNJ26_21100 [Desulfobacterales bacterium]|nr:hypothetical protein [Desulfobacterales bacterium]